MKRQAAAFRSPIFLMACLMVLGTIFQATGMTQRLIGDLLARKGHPRQYASYQRHQWGFPPLVSIVRVDPPHIGGAPGWFAEIFVLVGIPVFVLRSGWSIPWTLEPWRGIEVHPIKP